MGNKPTTDSMERDEDRPMRSSYHIIEMLREANTHTQKIGSKN